MSVASGKKVELAGFLDTGLDLSTDSITEAERERTLAWYREHHDHPTDSHYVVYADFDRRAPSLWLPF